jgi:hypothetical protein
MRLGRNACEEFLCRCKGLHLKPGRTQQSFYGPAEARVVLDESNGRSLYVQVASPL